MRTYRITSAGIDMGVYEGNTEAEALDAMARDAGYRDQAEAAEVAGVFEGTIRDEAEIFAVRGHGVYMVRAARNGNMPGRVLGSHEASCPNEAICVVKAEHATAPVMFPDIPGAGDWESAFEGATVEMVFAGTMEEWVATLPE